MAKGPITGLLHVILGRGHPLSSPDCDWFPDVRKPRSISDSCCLMVRLRVFFAVLVVGCRLRCIWG